METQRVPGCDRRQQALGSLQTLSDDILCIILGLLTPRDIGNLACVSSVLYILCNEEPLWMQLCLEKHEGDLQYSGSWRQTVLQKLSPAKDFSDPSAKPQLRFDGFSSAFLYRRWYRCHVSLENFLLDYGAVERTGSIETEEFLAVYDGKKPVLFTDLVKEWPAKHNWSLDKLLERCGGTQFKVSNPHGRSVKMQLKDFASYMSIQCDEEPLYIFDPKFGESAPELLQDYRVPTLFSDDLFSVMEESDRPPFRWFVMGPARSGASWHVDPSLTSAWNALLSGHKRWALYPPGRVPPGVTLDVDEDDGEINYDGPTSLQWWLDVYPNLEPGDKPLECTQLPGETIFVPSGWWHCVLNLDASVAVTQNFVNCTNLETVCLDMAPGYCHRAIARAGLPAVKRNAGKKLIRREGFEEAIKLPILNVGYEAREDDIGSRHMASKESQERKVERDDTNNYNEQLKKDALMSFAESNCHWSSSAKKGQLGGPLVREWLRKLWLTRPELEENVWKSACILLDAEKWLQRINCICRAHGLEAPSREDQMPVSDGSNPVYIIGDHVIKLYVQEVGTAAAINGLGSELLFYTVLHESEFPLRHVVPVCMASGIIYPDGEGYKSVTWDGVGDVPLVYKPELVGGKRLLDFDEDNKSRFRTKWAAEATVLHGGDSTKCEGNNLWPYIVTRRRRGELLSKLAKKITKDDYLSLATFLGENVRYLHTLPVPSVQAFTMKQGTMHTRDHQNSNCVKSAKRARKLAYSSDQLDIPINAEVKTLASDVCEATSSIALEVPPVWHSFVDYLRRRMANVHDQLKEWGSLPSHLMEQVKHYLPDDPVVLLGVAKIVNGVASIDQFPVWLHMDIMADNIMIESFSLGTNPPEFDKVHHDSRTLDVQLHEMNRAGYCIMDFGDVMLGDSLYELLPLFLDVFQLNENLLKQFLQSYGLAFSPIGRKEARSSSHGEDGYRLSYCAMCYCLLHEVDAMKLIFDHRKDLLSAQTLKEIEEQVWGALNEYVPHVHGF